MTEAEQLQESMKRSFVQGLANGVGLPTCGYCKDCAWWSEHQCKRIFLGYLGVTATIGVEKKGDCEVQVWLTTYPNHGCVMFEAKE